MDINHQPTATNPVDINFQPAAAQLAVDIKHQSDTVLTLTKIFFIQVKITKSSQIKCQNSIPILHSTYPEMQRKHIPTVYEYQL